MAISRRLLKDAPPTPSSTPERWTTEPPPMSVDSDVVVILAALLCAVICFVGLALVARCAWIRRRSSPPSHPPAPAPAPNKGLKRKELLSLPRLPFRGSDEKKISTECAICLAEFAEGDEIRVLPPCGHGFHVVCVDTWLKSHSSCPSCRRSLVPAAAASAGGVEAAATGGAGRCQRCGACSGVEVSSSEEDVPAADAVAATSVADGGEKAQNDGAGSRFLPSSP